jgi:hypothetical protein
MAGVHLIPCRQVTITSCGPVPAEVDGDAFTDTPLEIDEDGPVVRLIVPATYLHGADRRASAAPEAATASTDTHDP